MSKTMVVPVMLGHNPFFGVDHLSRDDGNAKAVRFEDSRQIAEMLLYCHDLGVRGMMISTHPRAKIVSETIGREPTLADSWLIYPLVPYLQKFVRGANEKGLVNMIADILTQTSLSQKLAFTLQGGRGVLTRDVRTALTMLIDIELLPFRGRRLGAVFLHDGLTDLALGLGIEPVLEVFRDHVERTYGVPAGFVTKNLPQLRTRLEGRDWTDLLIMASFNSLGFMVNPSLVECEQTVRRPGMTFVAMNTLAGGAIRPQVAYQYLSHFPETASVVVGMSRKEHATETVDMIKNYMPWLSGTHKLGIVSTNA